MDGIISSIGIVSLLGIIISFAIAIIIIVESTKEIVEWLVIEISELYSFCELYFRLYDYKCVASLQIHVMICLLFVMSKL